MFANADNKKADLLSEINHIMMDMERRYKTPHSIVKHTKQWLKGIGFSSDEGYVDALKVCLMMHGLEDVLLS